MDYTTFAQLLGNVGFPVAITIFLLVNIEKKLDQLEREMYRLSESMKDKQEE